MINNPISSLHLDASGISKETNLLDSAKITKSSRLLNLSSTLPDEPPSLSEKKLALLKRLLLLQKQSKMYEIGDPSLLLDENFELSPKNYSKLLEYMKITAQKLNQAITQSSEMLSQALGLSEKNEQIKIEEIPGLSHFQSFNSIDSNSTRESDQFLSQHPSYASLSPCFIKQRDQEISQSWDNRNDNMLMRLAIKYHKDWHKISKVLAINYQLNYKSDFLKNKYAQLTKQNEKVKLARKKLQEYEEYPKEDDAIYFKSKCEKKRKQDDIQPNFLGDESLNQIDCGEIGSYQVNEVESPKTAEKESVKLFFTKNEQLESKTLELPWINFDFDRDFGQEDELFERVTSCYN